MAQWNIPSALSAIDLREAVRVIEEKITHRQVLPEGKSIENLIVSKAAVTRSRSQRAAFDDENGEGSSASDGGEDFLFPAGGPTTRKPDGSPAPTRRRRRLRRANDSEGIAGDEVDEEAEGARERRAEARRKAELDKRRKIKSDLFVRDSDDESDEEKDEEFFRLEEERRNRAATTISAALGKRTTELSPKNDGEKAGKRRKGTNGRRTRATDEDEPDSRDIESEGSSGSDNNLVSAASTRTATPTSEKDVDPLDGTDGSDSATSDTPLSLIDSASPGVAARKVTSRPKMVQTSPKSDIRLNEDVQMVDASGSGTEGESIPARKVGRRQMRAGFIIESDSE